MNIYPWQNALLERLATHLERLPHALLFHGKPGIGKLDFAMAFSQMLLCASPVHHQACNRCPKCTWFNEGAHPDFYWITPEEIDATEDAPKKKRTKKTQISVEQIRQLIQALSLTNHGVNAFRVVLIEPAETLNQASANALLKILEEPPTNTVFVLVATQLQRLLPTIISRSHKLAMPVPSHAQALAWLTEQSITNPEATLAYAGGSPLLALKHQEVHGIQSQVLDLLAKGGKMDTQQCLGVMQLGSMEQALTLLQKWTYDLMLCRFTLPQHYHVHNTNALQTLAKSVHLNPLLGFQKTLILAKQTALHPLNMELQLEHLLIQYKKMFT